MSIERDILRELRKMNRNICNCCSDGGQSGGGIPIVTQEPSGAPGEGDPTVVIYDGNVMYWDGSVWATAGGGGALPYKSYAAKIGFAPNGSMPFAVEELYNDTGTNITISQSGITFSVIAQNPIFNFSSVVIPFYDATNGMGGFILLYNVGPTELKGYVSYIIEDGSGYSDYIEDVLIEFKFYDL